jgi:putative ATPase
MQPLAARVRPQTLDAWVGQAHIIGEGALLRRAIQADRLSSLILHGPPGTAKTTRAAITSHATRAHFVRLNATTSGVKDISKAVEDAKAANALHGRRTILFVDEIHRFNKAQQDALLPYVEDGTITLIGATTENPGFEVNKALVSRSMVFELHPLTKGDIMQILRGALDSENGLRDMNVAVDDDALAFLADMAGGDARAALNALELAALTTKPAKNGRILITIDIAQQCIQKRTIRYDKGGQLHYDTISAFIKSIRGSDPDAAIYYMARMLAAGEDPKFIARRIVVHAAEDVGNADPRALQLATAAFQAVTMIGMPEARIILAQAVAYIASAPKSNAAVTAISAAAKDVQDIAIAAIPPHISDAAIGYKYPHAYPGGYTPQEYLPEELKHRIYYNPPPHGAEKKIGEALRALRPERYK